MKVPTIAGFVGFNGDNVWLDPAGYPDDHPLVLARPDLFTDAPTQDRKRTRQPTRAKAEPTTAPKAVEVEAVVEKSEDSEKSVEAVADGD